MFSEYVETALARAEYKVIEDDEPCFASVPELPGVWASGKTVKECRRELIEVIEGWIVARLQRGLSIPPMGEQRIGASGRGRASYNPEGEADPRTSLQPLGRCQDR